MDLRDQFAMAAMQGMLASGIKAKSHISENAYEYADAMIEVRERDTGNVVLTQAEFRHLRGELIECKAQIQAILEASKR